MTIHDDIDSYLAADLHNELSEQEERALHTHLIECAACRIVHQESKIMNKVLEEKFANEKPDSAFEQRMLAGFRNRIHRKRQPARRARGFRAPLGTQRPAGGGVPFGRFSHDGPRGLLPKLATPELCHRRRVP